MVGLGTFGRGEEAIGGRLLVETAAVQEQYLIGDPLRLREIVRSHDDLRAAPSDGQHDVLDGARAGGIEAGRRLVEEQHLRRECPCPGQRELLLFADGQDARRVICEAAEVSPSKDVIDACRPFSARDAAERQRVSDVGGNRTAQHYWPLKDHRLVAAGIDTLRSGPKHLPGRWPQQAVAEPEQQALTGAVRADDDAERPTIKSAGKLLDQSLAARLERDCLQAKRQDGGASLRYLVRR